jgi:hypothetical protein
VTLPGHCCAGSALQGDTQSQLQAPGKSSAPLMFCGNDLLDLPPPGKLCWETKLICKPMVLKIYCV